MLDMKEEFNKIIEILKKSNWNLVNENLNIPKLKPQSKILLTGWSGLKTEN
jgi:hypothetical protein